jgi:hypothetical protein
MFNNKFLVFIFLFLTIFVNAQVKFVEVTGGSVIEENASIISKNNALEDALYLAALQGGAKISGYSIVDKIFKSERRNNCKAFIWNIRLHHYR